ncbi:MAG: hypothetical protein ACJ79H_00325 [Myxococcales bacterium]
MTPLRRPSALAVPGDTPRTLRLWAALLAVSSVVCLVAIQWFQRDPLPEEPESTATMAAVPARELAPAIVPEGRGRIEIVRPAKTEDLPPVQAEPLFEPDMRVNVDEPSKLRFAARDRASGRPVSGGRVSASVFHGNDPERNLKVEEVEDGVFEVELTPRGPGRFNVQLSLDGAVVASGRVGVVGVAGAPEAKTDVVDPSSVDPIPFRARTPGRARRR